MSWLIKKKSFLDAPPSPPPDNFQSDLYPIDTNDERYIDGEWIGCADGYIMFSSYTYWLYEKELYCKAYLKECGLIFPDKFSSPQEIFNILGEVLTTEELTSAGREFSDYYLGSEFKIILEDYLKLKNTNMPEDAWSAYSGFAQLVEVRYQKWLFNKTNSL